MLGLGACQSLPPVPESGAELTLQGKLKITLAQDVRPLNFRWTQTESGFEAYFWGTMGAGTTHLFGNQEQLTLESRDGIYSGPPEEIVAQHLGWSLPVELLLTWVRGVPRAGMEVEQREFDEDGRLESFQQAGWLLRFDDFDEHGRYTRLSAKRKDVSVLLVVKQRS